VKHLKMFGLAAMAAMALMAFAGVGSASATVLCHKAETPCSQKWSVGTEPEFIVRPETTARWFSGANTLMSCTGGDLKGTITNAGGSSQTVKIGINTFAWTSCNVGNTTLENGELEVHSISGSTNGTLTLKGFTTKIETTQYGTCIYTSGATGVDLGTLTASKTGQAIIDIIVVLTKKEGSSFLCPTTIEWWEEWTQTKPSETPLFVEPI
jgi:hypothetical protein